MDRSLIYIYPHLIDLQNSPRISWRYHINSYQFISIHLGVADSPGGSPFYTKTSRVTTVPADGISAWAVSSCVAKTCSWGYTISILTNLKIHEHPMVYHTFNTHFPSVSISFHQCPILSKIAQKMGQSQTFLCPPKPAKREKTAPAPPPAHQHFAPDPSPAGPRWPLGAPRARSPAAVDHQRWIRCFWEKKIHQNPSKSPWIQWLANVYETTFFTWLKFITRNVSGKTSKSEVVRYVRYVRY